MANTLDIRRRIRSVKNTQQITRAMKMVAAAKLRRAQDRISAARPYSAAMRQVLGSVATRMESLDHPLLRKREERRVLIVPITADKGLCGAFNANVIKATWRAMSERGWNDRAVIPIGRKANDHFRKRDVEIRFQAINIFQALSLDNARELAEVIIEDYTEEKVDAVYLIHNEFISVISQKINVEKLLPIEGIEDIPHKDVDYLYEPEPQKILDELLPKYVEFQIYRALLDSAAGEHGARMTAMEAATRNAGEMIEQLTLTYNRIRQASITKEIIEIVSGASALG